LEEDNVYLAASGNDFADLDGRERQIEAKD